MSTRPRLTPAIADVRRAVREALAVLVAGPGGPEQPHVRPPGADTAAIDGEHEAVESTVRQFANDAPAQTGASLTNSRIDGVTSAAGADILVALSGGPDSLALAAATAFEAPRAGLRAGAIIVDHGLQADSAEVATRAAQQARALGLDPLLVRRVDVGTEGGPEAAAREARYEALADAAEQTGARAVLLGHTLDDQAETVLLGLARGSGAGSLSGMARVSLADAGGGAEGQLVFARPMLGIRRAQTMQFCADSGLTPWHDPQNVDPAFTRVRVREAVLPMLEAELGPGIAEALARTAELAREDAEALDLFAGEQAEELADHAEAGLSLSVAGLASNPAALRQRIIRMAVQAEFGVSLARTHTLEVARLVTEWRGQGPLHLPGIRVVRQGGLIVFSAAAGGAQARG